MTNWKECSHEGKHSEHYDYGTCGTPYCEWTEFHCLECGRFVVRCGCGFFTQESGWPWSRWRKIYRRRELAAIERGKAKRMALQIGGAET